MPQGTPTKREKKKPKKDAVVKGVRSTAATPAPAVEIIGKRRKQRGEG